MGSIDTMRNDSSSKSVRLCKVQGRPHGEGSRQIRGSPRVFWDPHSARVRSVALMILLEALTGCSAMSVYFRDRGLDLVDIVNIRGGFSTKRCWFNLGVKAEVTRYFGAPAGLHLSSRAWEYFGRRSVQFNDASGIGLGGIGYCMQNPVDPENAGLSVFNWMDFYIAGLTATKIAGEFIPEARRTDAVPWHQRFRIGAALWLFPLDVGVFFNPVELIDFAAGIFGLDITGDDGMPLGNDLYVESHETLRRRLLLPPETAE